MYLQDNEKAQVVMMFSSTGIVKELLYPEFETLLDNYLPLPEWAGKTVRSVYLEVNSKSCVTAAVFFLLGFTDSGMVEASWNMPLGDLARTTFRGPNLGAGPIHIATESRCPVAFYQADLWEPQGDASSGHYRLIKHAVKSNKLGILFKAPDKVRAEPPAAPAQAQIQDELEIEQIEQKIGQRLSKNYEAQMQEQLAQLLEDQRQCVKELKAEHDKKIRSVCDDYEEQLKELSEGRTLVKTELHKSQSEIQELLQTIDGQTKKIDGLREYFEHKLQRAETGADGSLGKVIEEMAADGESRSVAKELTDSLKMKELELQHRKEHESQLREELRILRDDYDLLQENSGVKLLDTLSQKGVNFVTYQPGAGHITIPVPEIESFTENPIGFTATFLDITELHYQAWIEHFQAPVCKAMNSDGEMCCEGLDRKTSPIDFIEGQSNFCDKHQQIK